ARWGYINEQGSFVSASRFKSATVFQEGLAFVVEPNGAPRCVNVSGETVFNLSQAEKVQVFSEGLAAFSIIDSLGEVWGFVNNQGAIVVSPQFKQTGSFSEGLCRVANSKGDWGYIDLTGNLVIGYQFDLAKDFQNGQAVVGLNKKQGAIDKECKFIINPQFKSMESDGDRFVITMDRKFGWCDADGRIIINPQFDMAYGFGAEGLAVVKSGRNFGYIDSDGKFVINPQFDFALPFNKGIACVLTGRDVGFIDKEGKYIVNPQFDGTSPDVLSTLTTGKSTYDIATTDFFNLNAVLQRIDFEKPEGLSLNSSFGDVLAQYGKTTRDFYFTGNKHKLFSRQKITSDAQLAFYFLGRPDYKMDMNDFSYRVQESTPVNGYVWVLKLSGRGSGKAEMVMEELEKKLSGYTLKSDGYRGRYKEYVNSTSRVKLLQNGDYISITIIREDSDPTFSNLTDDFRDD
ncbi:MAG: WG repeat-containing protein, partial [Bacteroidota bacterium]